MSLSAAGSDRNIHASAVSFVDSVAEFQIGRRLSYQAIMGNAVMFDGPFYEGPDSFNGSDLLVPGNEKLDASVEGLLHKFGCGTAEGGYSPLHVGDSAAD
jgi:hypothetical protein